MKILENPENRRPDEPRRAGFARGPEEGGLYREKEELLFAMDEKSHEADLTEKGRNFVSPQDPEAFVLPDLTTRLHDIDAGAETDARKRMEAKTKLQKDFEAKAQKIHAISQLLKAYSLYQLDVEYVVQENKVIIVDQHTGRPMPGRRWSDGLHQAVEAKEGVDDRARDADARHHHDPELFPPLPKTRRHDRHGGNRGDRISRHLQARRAGDPDEQAEHPQGRDTIQSTKPSAKNSTPSSRKSRNCTPRAGRFSSARSPSKPAKCFRGCSSAKG